MGSLARLIVFVFIFASITLKTNTQYLLPITKHEPTKQFYTTLTIGATESSPVNLLLDLGTNLTLVDCDKVPLSQFIPCQSSTCISIPSSYCDPDGLFCLYRHSKLNTAIFVQDRVFISTTDGGKFLFQVSFDNFIFSCADDKTVQDFPPPLSGVLSLSPLSLSFTKQVTSAFSVPLKFSLCLPSSGYGNFHIASDSTRPFPMTSTPMTFSDSGDYLILVQSIYVDGTPISLDPLILISEAKLSTVVPYTELHTDVYDALAQSFTLKAKAMGISMVPSVAPFKHCFDARTAGKNMTGPNVPVIEIGLLGDVNATSEVKWGFYGANTLVKVNETVMCLAFIDGGIKRDDFFMVIGTYQLQDFMIEFDFSTKGFAFSESLLRHDITCSTWPSQN